MFKELPALFGKDSLLGGGRDEFEQMLLGTPETEIERLNRAKAGYEHERGGERNVVSKWFLGKVSHSGDDLEKTHRELEKLRPTLNEFSGKDPKSLSAQEQEELSKAHQELTRLTGYQEADVKLYQEAKDNVANSAATGAAVVAGAAATIATGGAAGPAAAAVIGSLAGGGASIATKLAIKGQDYSTEDLQRDAIETGAMALTAGAGQLGAVGKGLNSALKIGPAGGGFLKEAAKGAIIGSVTGAVGAAAGEAINRDNYLGEGTFGEKFTSHVGRAALAGGLGGGLGAGLGGAFANTSFGRSNGLFSAAVSGAGGGLGGGLANGLVSGDAELDWQAALAGAIGGLAGAHQGQRYHQAQQSRALANGPRSAVVEPHLTGQQYSPTVAEHPQVPALIDASAAVDKAAGRGSFAGYGPPPEAPALELLSGTVVAEGRNEGPPRNAHLQSHESLQGGDSEVAISQKQPRGVLPHEDVSLRGATERFALSHHGANAAQHQSQIQAAGLEPIDSIKVNNATIKVGQLFNIGDGRIGAFIEVEVNGQRHLRAVYRSNSQGSLAHFASCQPPTKVIGGEMSE